MVATLFKSEIARAVAPLALLLVVWGLWRAGTLPATAATALEQARDNGPSQAELDQLNKNYYQGLLEVASPEAGARMSLVGEFARRIVPGGQGAPDDANIRDSGAAVETGGFLRYELKPDYETTFRGQPLKTNRWGLRDGDYEQAKPPGTFRIALIGASPTFGSGVEADEMYEGHLERLLNEQLAGTGGPAGPFARYEILNFSMPGLSLLERVYMAQEKTPAFEPDLILVTLTRNDLRWMVCNNLALRITEGRDLHYDFLKEIVERAGVSASDTRVKIERKLEPRVKAIISECLEELAAFSSSRGIPVAAMALRIQVGGVPASLSWPAEIAAAHGLPVLRVYDAYEGRSTKAMYRDPGRDDHPTPLAHRLLAREILELLLADPELGPLLREGTVPVP